MSALPLPSVQLSEPPQSLHEGTYSKLSLLGPALRRASDHDWTCRTRPGFSRSLPLDELLMISCISSISICLSLSASSVYVPSLDLSEMDIISIPQPRAISLVLANPALAIKPYIQRQSRYPVCQCDKEHSRGSWGSGALDRARESDCVLAVKCESRDARSTFLSVRPGGEMEAHATGPSFLPRVPVLVDNAQATLTQTLH